MHPDPVPTSNGARSVRPDQCATGQLAWESAQDAPAPGGTSRTRALWFKINVLPPHDPGSSGHIGVSKETGQRQSMTGVKGQ